MILEMYFSKKTRLIGFHMEPPTSLFSKYGVLEQKEYASYFHSLRIEYGAPRQSKFEPVSLFARAVVASSKVMVFVPSL